MSISPAPTDTAPATVEASRPKMHARLPSLDQLRASANSKLGNLDSLSTHNLPPSNVSGAPSPSSSTRLNRSLLSRKESISSIASIQEQPSALNSPASDGTAAPGSAGGASPSEGVLTFESSPKAMGSKAPERWKSVPTLSEIRERHMAAAASALAGKEAAVEAVGDEKKAGGEEQGEKATEVVRGGGGLQKRKGPLADLLTRKEVVLDEMIKPPPTPVPEFRVVKEEHPLGHTWTMTYSPPIIPTSSTLSNLSLDDSSAPTTVATPSVSSLYTSSLLHLGDFSTIESWARLTNHLSTVPPSMLSKGGNFQLFKKGVEPIFEDPANEKGGKWVLTMRGHRASTLDDAWRETILCLVGEALEVGSSDDDEEDQICGAVVSVRAKADRIQLWIKSKDPVNLVNGIGKRFVKALGLDKEGGRPAQEGSFSLEFQYNQGSAPPISKYLTLSSSTSSSLTRPGVKGAWRTNSSSAVPSLGAVGEGVGA